MHLAVVPVRLQFAQAATFRRLNLSSSSLRNIAAHCSVSASHFPFTSGRTLCDRHVTTRGLYPHIGEPASPVLKASESTLRAPAKATSCPPRNPSVHPIASINL